MDEGEEVFGTPVVPCGDVAEMLEFVDASLDAVAEFVVSLVQPPRPFARWIGWDDASRARAPDFVPKGTRIEGCVRDHGFGLLAFDQGRRMEKVMGLAWREHRTQWPPQRVAQQVDLGRQTSSGTPQSLIFGPPFPLAAC